MANESTTTTMNDIISSEVIEVVGLDYAYDWSGISRFCLPGSLIGTGSATQQFWRLQSVMGTVGDAGNGVDTEFDGTEGTDLANTALSTDQVQVTASEFGIKRTLTDNVFEDSIGGMQFVQMVVSDAARILMTAFEDDLAALLGNFSNTAGSTGANLSLANLSTCIVGIRNRGVRAPDGLVFYLDEQQVTDFEDAITNTDAAAAQYAGAADRFLQMDRDANNGLTDGAAGQYRGVPIHMTGLTDTANSNADVEGACFVPFTPANRPFAALAMTTAREFRVNTQRQEGLRATEYVATMRKGGGELNDVCGQTIISDQT